MGKLDISKRISNEPTFLHISDTMEYKVDDSKNTVFKIMEMWNDDKIAEFEKLDNTIKLALGKKAYDEIEKAGFSIDAYKTIAISIMAVISGVTLEEMESRFQDGQ
jgi:hypothetical protein